MHPEDVDLLLETTKQANSAAYDLDCGIVVLETNTDHMLVGIYSTDDVDADDEITQDDCIGTAKIKVHGDYAGCAMLSVTNVEDGAVERIVNSSGINLFAMLYV